MLDEIHSTGFVADQSTEDLQSMSVTNLDAECFKKLDYFTIKNNWQLSCEMPKLKDAVTI